MLRAWLTALILVVGTLAASAGGPSTARAQASTLELTFTPIDRAQIAVWVEREDGTFMGTLALTYAVAKAGIGNRPGALQFNSGFRWPYGRREGVLPVWAHRRVTAPGAKMFRRVIFQDRHSEGDASRTSNDMSPDNYYCLSFVHNNSAREALDAVTCASVFSSDKGRFITEADLQKGYSEPYEDRPGAGRKRVLDLASYYPPRRDSERCTTPFVCYDHPDISTYRSHALEVMPELDAVTRATLPGKRPTTWTFTVPENWPRTERYRLFLEINVEGDYNEQYGPTAYPTPKTPTGMWDSWAMEYGYPYRGQPSVVFALPFELKNDTSATTLDPIGFGALHGEHGDILPMTKSITNDPGTKMGSGADRLLAVGNARASLRVMTPDSPYCTATARSGPVQALKVTTHPDKIFAHMWVQLSFLTPSSARPIGSYQIEVKAADSDWEPAFTPDDEQELLPVALDICADPNGGVNRCEGLPPGSPLEATIAGLRANTQYQFRVTPRDRPCAEMGDPSETSFTTPERTFTTVTPCFVATAAYGSPLASQIGVLRALRDRHLANHALGRAFIDLYYAVGPTLAEPVREHPWLAAGVRALLTPVVSLVDWWMN